MRLENVGTNQALVRENNYEGAPLILIDENRQRLVKRLWYYDEGKILTSERLYGIGLVGGKIVLSSTPDPFKIGMGSNEIIFFRV